MFKGFRALEFSKKMAVLVLSIYAIFMFVVVGLSYFNIGIQAVGILQATIAIPLIEIAAFSTKAGFENVQKIVNSKIEGIIGTTTTTTTDSTTTQSTNIV